MDAPRQAVLSAIKDYEIYLEFLLDRQRMDLQSISYSKGAVYELLERVKNQKAMAPLLILEMYRDEVENYSHYNPETSFMFLMARDTANNIIDMLLTQGYS